MAKPTLEGLPAELLILILLEISDLASLKSIVLSSPILHQSYITVRQESLCRIVKNQWGLLLGDAVVATRSRGLQFDAHKHKAIALLDTWRRKEEISNLALNSSIPIDEPSNLEEIFHLLHLHNVFHFFLKEYETEVPRPPWISNDQWENSIHPIELSHTERHRVLRALCRLQICANIFGEYENTTTETVNHNHWRLNPKHDLCCDEEAYRVLFGTMPPWEFQEIGSLWAYLATLFDHIYKDISAGLYELVEKHATRVDWARELFEELPEDVQPPWWNGVDKLGNVKKIWGFSRSLAAMGPEFVYRGRP
ncbi:hypothetical protein N7449_008289 [Penicillium cf. viridicatum]|uniref:F-box domain-containing protein n=1 Tax=Penicillium cf. viridicatum TaxID=2972119 RepID=A0A9W9J9Q6_9EURO|nr:hypothetical protein N7449_008289 [Penicillium cf. viridicatum]